MLIQGWDFHSWCFSFFLNLSCFYGFDVLRWRWCRVMELCHAGICNYSVWAERLAFRGHIPIFPSSPLVRHSSLPPPPTTGWSHSTNMSLPVLASFVLFWSGNLPPTTLQGQNNVACSLKHKRIISDLVSVLDPKLFFSLIQWNPSVWIKEITPGVFPPF